MELTQAISILRKASEVKQEEANALNLAVSVLEGQFAPELEVLEVARRTITEKENVIRQKEDEIAVLATEKAVLESKVPKEEISKEVSETINE